MVSLASATVLCLQLLLFEGRLAFASSRGRRNEAADAGAPNKPPHRADEQQQLQPSFDFELAPPDRTSQPGGVRRAGVSKPEVHARQLESSSSHLGGAGGQSSDANIVSASIRRLFRAIEYERVPVREASAPCLRVDQRSAVTALLLTIIFPSSAHFYYGYVVLGVIQLCLSVLVYLPLCLACGWWWRPVQPVMPRPYAFGGDEDSLNDTAQKVRSRATVLVVMVIVALVVMVVLTLWQLAMIVRLATGDMLPANSCPSSPL